MFGKLLDVIKKGNDRTVNNEIQIKNQNTSIMNLEMQLRQIHNLLLRRAQRNFLSDGEEPT